MKSIILSFLLLCLFPFVAFSRPSSTTFISDNPIVLPTTTHTHNNDEVTAPVLDDDGEPLKIDEEYIIVSALIGGGAVYLANLGTTKCPNAVAQYTSGRFGPGTPVKFFTRQHGGHFIHENHDVNIMFSTPTCELCVNETFWEASLPFIGPPPLPPRLVVTGGTLGKSWFKIERYVTGRHNSYKLRYCNSDCVGIGLTGNSGLLRLSLNNEPNPFAFFKVKK